MRHLPMLMLTMLLTAVSVGVQAQENVLVIDDFEGGIDKTVYVPVYLNNTDTVVAAQFEIELPFVAPADGVAMLSMRASRHSVSFKCISPGSKTYRVVIMNTANYPLRGNSGLLVRIPMMTYDDNQTATPYPITISNLVLTDKLGNNIATESSAQGNFLVNSSNLPDITVTDITPQQTQCAPGGLLTISYDVKNIGAGATLAGWTEKIYLESVTGTRTYLGCQSYSSTLAAQTTLSRTFTATLPNVMHIDGEVYVVVDLVPAANMGELTADQGNNNGTSETAVTLSKLLYLSFDGNTIYEGQKRGYVSATLTRSGDWALAETFTIDCPVSGLLTCNGLTLPCTVTIPAQAAGATLRIAAVDDQIVRARETDLTVSSTTGYQSVTQHLNRVDNDRNPLSLALSPSTTLAEGEKLTLTATRGGELTDELTLNVGCTHAARFDKAFTLHFAVGQSLASIQTTAIDDETPQLDAKVKWTASATDYQTATATLTLTDDDRPELTMTLSQPSVMENAAGDDEALPLTVTIRRDRGLDRNATIWLSSSRSEVTFENSKVSIPAGSEEIVVPVRVTDNSQVDGQRNVTLTAAFYAPSDQLTAQVGDRANAQQVLTVIDDETPYLTLSSRVSAVGEGASVEVTVHRYVVTTSAPLSVTLRCDDSRVSFDPQPVTIPAGYSSATFYLKVARNSIEGDDSDILLTATASGVSDGLLRMHVTDRTLPDAVSTTIACVGSAFYSGLPATIRATIRNYGTSELPQGMTVDFYLANTSRLYYYTSSTRFFQGTTDDVVAVSGEKTFVFETQLPQMVGQYWIYARLNPDKKIAEFNTGNNLTQTFCPITIEAPFEVETIAASPADLLPGAVVTVQGRMKAVEGSLLNRQTVRVTLDGAGQSTSADTQIDTDGNFKVNVKIDRSAHGYMTVKALALGQTEPAKTTRVHVYNMYLSTASTRWDVDENIQENGSLTLHNTSAKNITISDFATTQPLPDGAEITFDTSGLLGTTIQGGSSVNIPYTVKGAVPSASRQSFTISVKSQEGLETTLPISYFCHATSAYLVFTPRELKTTMLFNADRDNVTVTVKNCGKKTTGKISELITNDWVMSDFGNNRTLEPGESATIHLRLLAQPDMHVGRVYKNLLQLTPENGEAASLPITVTTTGDEYSTFDVFATDVYSKAQGDFSHVADAAVTIANARTGALVMTGTTDSEGHWTTAKMKEGLYNVTVKAHRHLSVTRQVAVGPGEDRQLSVLLPYKAFVADFVVDQDLSTNTYTMKQYFNIDLLAPQAIVVAYISDDGFGCGSETVKIRLCNVGRRPATNVKLTFPIVGGYTFTQLTPLPTVMMPGDVHVMEVAYEGPAEGRSRVISALKMYYAFDIQGETLSETDEYQILVGCANIIDKPVPPVVEEPVWPDDPDKPGNDDPWDPYNPENPWQPGGGNGGDGGDGGNDGPSGGVALPSYKSFMAIDFDVDLKSLRCGQPFHATLRVMNGDSGKLRSLRFTPQVSDDEFEDCTSLFTFTEGETTGFTADGQYRQLAAGTEGTMALTFVPLNAAAASGPMTYYISGLVSYVDSKTGIHNTASLPLFEMKVEPIGQVTVTYLIQRNFLADDNDTEAVEDAQPVMFSLLARNTGSIAVQQLLLTSSQPVVIDNATSRQVPYTAHYASLDGQEGNYTFADFRLSYLEQGTTAAARWIYSSEKSGHVADMNITAQIGFADLSIASQSPSDANITMSGVHELYHAVGSARTAAVAATDDESTELELQIQSLTQADTYLVNDIDDEQGLPDGVITATGDVVDLNLATSGSSISAAEGVGNYTLTVKSGVEGWFYGQLHDPTNGLMRLASVTRRSDNRQMPLANFWQTDRTPLADYTMLQERLLHFADSIDGTDETYDLHFVARPNEPVELMAVRLLTADDTEVEPGGVTTQPVKKIEVSFTAPLKRFVLNGVALTAHEKTLSVSKATSSSSSDKSRWTIDISKLEEIPGEHVLIFTSDKLKSASGDKVVGSAELTWTENLEGEALITINVSPMSSCGTTTPSTGSLPYGMQTLKAIPAEGYQFDAWADGTTGRVLSTDAEWDFDVWRAQSLTAVFSIQQLTLDVDFNDESGDVAGLPSGIYDYGTSIDLLAMPAENYSFLGWLIDGEMNATDNPQLSITIRKDTQVKAVFARNASMQIDMAKGWNWVSSYLSEPLSIASLAESVHRILSQTDEVINDPLLGLVGNISLILPGTTYKVEATAAVTWPETGYLYEVKEHPVFLKTGWNWMGYPYLEEKTLASTIVNADEGDYITAQLGFAEFVDGVWKGTLSTLVPGVGYLYKSAADKQLQFDFKTAALPSLVGERLRVGDGTSGIRLGEGSAPAGMGLGPVFPSRHHADNCEMVDPHAYPSTMNIIAQIGFADLPTALDGSPDEYVILAYAGDELRGVSQCVDDLHYLTVYGDQPVELTFMVKNIETGETFAVAVEPTCGEPVESIQFCSDVLGSRKSPVIFTVGTVTGISTQIGSADEPVTPHSYDLQGRQVKNNGQRHRKAPLIINHKVVVK